jgi:uncharacterized lipoprotein YbaY
MRPWLRLSVSLVALLLPILTAVSVMADQVTGTATYRERIAMLPGTRFEAVLEDVSRPDEPAKAVGRYETDDAGNPPFGFAIEYDPAEIDPARTYSVRARLTGPDGRLLFVTDMIVPVLTRGAPDRVELLLKMATGLPQPTTPMPRPAPIRFELPRASKRRTPSPIESGYAITTASGPTRFPVPVRLDAPVPRRIGA